MIITKNYLYSLSLTLSQIIFPIITFSYSSRILGVSAIGLTAYVESITSYFLIFAKLGIPIYGMRLLSQYRENEKIFNIKFFEIFSLQLFTSILCGFIYFLSLFFFNDFYLYWKLYAMGGILILSNVFSIEWLFQSVENFKYITIRSLLIKLFTTVLLFILVKNESDYNKYFFLLIFSSFANGLVNYMYARKLLGFTFAISIKNIKEHIKPIFLASSYMINIGVFYLISILILGAISNFDSVGYYSVATKLNRISIGIFSALTAVLLPHLSYNVLNDKDFDFGKTIKKSIHFVISLSLPISVSIYLLAPELVSIVSGSGYQEAISCVQIMSPILIIIGLSQIFINQILIPFSEDKKNILLALSAIIISVFINLFFIFSYNHIGASFATIIVEIFVLLISFRFARRLVFINFKLIYIIKNLIFIIPYFAFSFFLKSFLELDYQIVLVYSLISAIYFLTLQYFNKNFFCLDFIKK